MTTEADLSTAQLKDADLDWSHVSGGPNLTGLPDE